MLPLKRPSLGPSPGRDASRVLFDGSKVVNLPGLLGPMLPALLPWCLFFKAKHDLLRGRVQSCHMGVVQSCLDCWHADGHCPSGGRKLFPLPRSPTGAWM